jgi:Mn2+/Fe2+ NRAMP family transporter
VKLSDLGPGLLLAATGVGVGDMVASTIAGAEHGLTLLWAVAAGVVVKFAITEGAARWQLATGRTLVEGWRDHLPRALLALFGLYFLIWSYFVSSALVSASALVPAAIFPSVPLAVWGAVHALVAFIAVFVGRYQRFLSTVKTLIAFKFATVVAAAVIITVRSGAHWAPVGQASPFSTVDTLSLIGGVGGTVTLLSYGYWMREAGWSGRERLVTARTELSVSFALVLLFCASMMVIATNVSWQGHILEEGPRLCLLLADRIGEEIGPVGRAIFLAGFWGTAFTSVLGVWHGVPFLFDDWFHLWRRQKPAGHTGSAYRLWLTYLALAALSALFIGRPVWLVYAYTVVGSFFFPFVISTLLWLNNAPSAQGNTQRAAPNGMIANAVLGAALLLYVLLALRSVVG